MPLNIRALSLSVRALEKSPAGLVVGTEVRTRTGSGSRRRIHLASRPTQTPPCIRCAPSHRYASNQAQALAKAEPESPLALAEVQPDPSRPKHPNAPTHEYLGALFPSLKFPDELVRRMMTHKSHRGAVGGHNGRLSFIGRRVLEAYLLMFLHSSPPPARLPTLDYALLATRALNTITLGEHVALQWDLYPHLRWRPALQHEGKGDWDGDGGRKRDWEEMARKYHPRVLQQVGIYKVAGMTVEAVVGGVFHQFGGTVAHRVFHTRLLPHLFIPDSPFGLNDAFQPYAEDIAKRMGGYNGPLIVKAGNSKATRKAETAQAQSGLNARDTRARSKVEMTSSSEPGTDQERSQERGSRVAL